MALKITFGNQKGGTGKTTLTVLLATALSQDPFNYNVCVVDCDNQKSVVNARLDDMDDNNSVIPYEVYNYNVPTLLDKIKDLNSRYDIIFIDTAGKLDIGQKLEDQEITKVLMLVDILFIPFVHGNYTLNATIDYLKFVLRLRNARKAANRPLTVYGMLNMYDRRLNSSKDLRDEIDEIKLVTGIDFIKTPLSTYTLYRTANTMDSIYSDKEKSDYMNFKQFLKEIHNLITL